MGSGASPLEPLAAAIAEIVSSGKCVTNWPAPALEPDRASSRTFRFAVLVPGALEQNLVTQKAMLKTRMDFLKGDTSTDLQLKLNAWHQQQMRDRLSKKRRSALWAGIVSEQAIPHDVDFDRLMDGLILCADYVQEGTSPGVYFLRTQGVVKIGYSDRPDLRIAQIKSVCPFPVIHEVSVAGDMWLERYLHVAFAEDRSHLEWFRDSPTLNELIRILKVLRGQYDPRRRQWRA